MTFREFEQSEGGQMFDSQMERQLDEFIQEHVGKGYDDDQII